MSAHGGFDRLVQDLRAFRGLEDHDPGLAKALQPVAATPKPPGRRGQGADTIRRNRRDAQALRVRVDEVVVTNHHAWTLTRAHAV